MNDIRDRITVAIHQPDYIPWLGLYYKMAHCDIFVYLDDAQYSNEADHNVNLIKTPQGKLRIKVPVEQHLGDLICDVRTKDELKWKEKQLKTIQMNYSKAKHFDDTFPGFKQVILNHRGSIAELNIAINQYICKGFKISPMILKSSELNVEKVREERIIEITKKLGGTDYLSGTGAKVYQTESHFKENGIRLNYLDYIPVEYNQLWPKVGFIPCMSVLDYIFNCGFDWNYIEESVKRLNYGNR